MLVVHHYLVAIRMLQVMLLTFLRLITNLHFLALVYYAFDGIHIYLWSL